MDSDPFPVLSLFQVQEPLPILPAFWYTLGHSRFRLMKRRKGMYRKKPATPEFLVEA